MEIGRLVIIHHANLVCCEPYTVLITVCTQWFQCAIFKCQSWFVVHDGTEKRRVIFCMQCTKYIAKFVSNISLFSQMVFRDPERRETKRGVENMEAENGKEKNGNQSVACKSQ